MADRDGRRVQQQPLYSAEEIAEVVRQGADAIVLWTRKCQDDVKARVWDNEDVLQLLKDALSMGKRLKPEWCWAKPEGPIAACDVYKVMRREAHPSSGRTLLMEYYLKFAIAQTGKAILIVSCHTTEK